MWFPPLYKTINNINIVFCNCLRKRYKFAIFFTLDEILMGQVTISESLKKFNFQKISGQTPLITCNLHFIVEQGNLNIKSN